MYVVSVTKRGSGWLCGTISAWLAHHREAAISGSTVGLFSILHKKEALWVPIMLCGVEEAPSQED